MVQLSLHICMAPPTCSLPIPTIQHTLPPSHPHTLQQDFGWGAYFSTLIGACAVAFILLSPMTNLRSHIQRKESWIKRTGGKQA